MRKLNHEDKKQSFAEMPKPPNRSYMIKTNHTDPPRSFRFLPIFLILIGLHACLPPEPEAIITEVEIDFREPGQQQLYEYQNRGLTDSLVTYFDHRDPAYRYLAARAFGSIRDSAYIEEIAGLFDDPVEEVRTAAAFALGQIGSGRAESYLITGFDTSRTYHEFDAVLMEALGKSGTRRGLSALESISTYTPQDTALLRGRAYGFYRYGQREMISEVGTEAMIDYATDPGYPQEVRFVAANYLGRTKDVAFDERAVEKMVRAVGREPDPRVRMMLAFALGKSKQETAFNALTQLIRTDADYRVRTNALQALRNFSYQKIKPVLVSALYDANYHVGRTAAIVLADKGSYFDAADYYLRTRDTLSEPVKMALYRAASRHLPGYSGYRGRINYELQFLQEQSDNLYERGAALLALGEYPPNFRYLMGIARQTDNPYIKSTAVWALEGLVNRPNFRSFFGANWWIRAKEISEFFQETVLNGDSGAAYYAALGLRQATIRETIEQTAFLDVAMSRLELPRQIETYNALLETKANVTGTEYVPRPTDFYHPIDWKWVETVYEQDQLVLRTRHGDIVMDLLPELAPATLASLARLSEDRFYDGTVFHRVVDNYVIQGGDPRGDGYGGLDFTLRSELTEQHYDQAGYVGMASAGNHTEGTQFFITHSPALHLDGKYTIFARVTDGMEVVHEIRPGDVVDVMLLK